MCRSSQSKAVGTRRYESLRAGHTRHNRAAATTKGEATLLVTRVSGRGGCRWRRRREEVPQAAEGGGQQGGGGAGAGPGLRPLPPRPVVHLAGVHVPQVPQPCT